jgi:hypothetical protein
MARDFKFKRGDRVKVINDGLQTYGFTGQVKATSYWGDTIEVELDQINKVYTYKSNNLMIDSEQNNTIKGDNNMLVGNYKIAMVKFVQGTNTVKGYAFGLFDNDVEVGDLVLCDTSNGYNVAKVEEIIPKSEYNGTTVTKEIICKVDFTNYENRKANREKAVKLKAEMDKKIKEMQELTLFEMMAEKSPELKEMLEAYKGLLG